MTGHDDFDRTLVGWFEADALSPGPADAHDRVLDVTRRRRPRPAWLADLGSQWVGEASDGGWIVRGRSLPGLERRWATAFIVLLAAGLLSTGVGRLQGLGLLPTSEPLWNTSWLLSDRSVTGSFLSGLIGYRSQPTLPEVVAYVAYLVVAWVLLFARRTPAPVALTEDPIQL